MSKITKKGSKKLEKVIRYIACNYKIENFRGDLQLTRILKFIELLNHKYKIVEYEDSEIIKIIENSDKLELKERESVYGNKYRYVKVEGKYGGEGLDKGVINIIGREMGYTEEMSFNQFQSYVYDELILGVTINLT